ncbi:MULTISPECIES: hypothetical protein [Aerosakkonema]
MVNPCYLSLSASQSIALDRVGRVCSVIPAFLEGRSQLDGLRTGRE